MQGDGEKEIPFFFPKEKIYVSLDMDAMTIFSQRDMQVQEEPCSR